MGEEQTQQFVQQLQMLEQHVNDLTRREHALVDVLQQIGSAIDAVTGLGEKEDSDTLVPVGVGVFIQTKVSSKESIFLDVGAGVMIERDRRYTLSFLESKMKEIEVALQDVSTKRDDAVDRLKQGAQEMNTLLQSGGAS